MRQQYPSTCISDSVSVVRYH